MSSLQICRQFNFQSFQFLCETINHIKNYTCTSLGTQRVTGYSLLLPPFTRTSTIFNGKLNFCYKSHSLVILRSLINIWGNSVHGFLSCNRTYKQTIKHPNRDYNFIYIDIQNNSFIHSFTNIFVYMRILKKYRKILNESFLDSAVIILE